MAMQLAALDILITKGGFAPESARAIGEAVDLEIERSRDSLATGQQLTDTRLMLEGQLTDTRIKLEQQITALEHKVGEFRLELLGKIESTKAEVLRWMFGAMTGQTVVLVALIRLLR
jgi:hypothetical protein